MESLKDFIVSSLNQALQKDYKFKAFSSMELISESLTEDFSQFVFEIPTLPKATLDIRSHYLPYYDATVLTFHVNFFGNIKLCRFSNPDRLTKHWTGENYKNEIVNETDISLISFEDMVQTMFEYIFVYETFLNVERVFGEHGFWVSDVEFSKINYDVTIILEKVTSMNGSTTKWELNLNYKNVENSLNLIVYKTYLRWGPDKVCTLKEVDTTSTYELIQKALEPTLKSI